MALVFDNVVGRACTTCRKVQPIEAYTKVINKGIEFRYKYCNGCRQKRQTMLPSAQYKRKIVEEAKNKPCADCGNQFHQVAMDFDHIRGVKSFNISSSWRCMSEERIRAELAKCEVVCANCHRIRSMVTRPSAKRGRPTKYLADVEEPITHLDLTDAA